MISLLPWVWKCKLLFIMKLTFSLSVLCVLQAFATDTFSQNLKLNINQKNITVKGALRMIEDKTDYYFMYSALVVDDKRVIDIEAVNKSVPEILDDIFKGTDISYVIDGRLIALSKEGESSSFIQQARPVSGKVTDTSGSPLPGVSVIIKGTNQGIVTDGNGNYSLLNVSENAVLVFSFVGMKVQEITVGGKTQINVKMEEETLGINEVVVTALGISREKKVLGYAVQEVKGELVEKSKELDINNSLNGRVAGVFVSQGRANVGNSNARIVIRGESSISGSNTPLYIVDGFPASYADPNDIESMSVLKGPAATALYGSRASGGVIVITTKTGKKAKGVRIDINSSMTVANPKVLPDYQTDYGQGMGGVYNSAKSSSWGPAFAGSSAIQQLWGGNEWKCYKDNVEKFYQTGTTFNNNVSINSSDEISDFRLSFTDVRQKGMIPETSFRSHNIDLNTSRRLNDKLEVKANVKFKLENTPNNSSYDPRLMPLNVSLEALKEYWNEETNSQVIWQDQNDNPYFSLHEDEIGNKTSALVGNLVFSYDFTSYLNLTVRGSGSLTNGKDFQERAFGHLGNNSNGLENKYGSYYLNKSTSSETNCDFLLTYNKSFKDWSVKVSLGGNNMITQGEYLNATNEQLLVPASYTMSNHRHYPIVNSYIGPKKIINSLYSFANLGYKDMVYLDLTARNDWSSALPRDNNSYFYPSAALSVLMNNMINLPSAISLWKVRANYAMVGNDTDAGQLQMLYYFTTGSNGTAGISEENTLPELNLKPELTTAFEIGSELNLLNSRLKLDFTYYKANTKNQIWAVQLSDVTGYEYAIKNAGKVRNRGFEIMLGGTPLVAKDFSWNTSLNWSADRSVVLELDPSNPDLKYTQSVASYTYTMDQIGERRGQIYSRTGRRFIYDPEVHEQSLAKYDGALYYDAAKDLPRVSEISVIGNVNPDWIAGWENTFNYKNWTLSTLFVGVYGNSYYAGFEKSMMDVGLDPVTGGDRDAVLPEGVWDSPEGVRPFQPGDEITADAYYGDYLVDGQINDIWVKDGSYFKLKEASLSYNLPSRIIKYTFLKGATLSVIGRNLISISKAKYEDPEIYQGKTPGISNSGNVPMPRTWTCTLNLKF